MGSPLGNSPNSLWYIFCIYMYIFVLYLVVIVLSYLFSEIPTSKPKSRNNQKLKGWQDFTYDLQLAVTMWICDFSEVTVSLRRKNTMDLPMVQEWWISRMDLWIPLLKRKCYKEILYHRTLDTWWNTITRIMADILTTPHTGKYWCQNQKS